MIASFATSQQALDALDTDTRDAVFIAGVPVDCIGWDTQHDVDAALATCRLTLPLPRSSLVTSNATVEVQAGYNDFVDTRFHGRIPSWEGAVTLRGNLLTVRAVGWCSLLNESERFDLIYAGPISLRALFIAFCQRYLVPSYIADAATYPDGVTEIMIGGNRAIDDGNVILPAGTTPLSFLNRLAEPYGYRVYDTPSGAVRLSRVSGLPPGDPVVTFTEGINLHTVTRGHDISGKINYWDVNGVTYEDDLGARIPIRSIAASIPFDPDLAPKGYRYRRVSNNDIVTQDAADAIRENYEINFSEAHTPVKWDAVAVPGLSVGDVVAVEAETVETTGTYWLMGMDLSNANGLTGRYDGWAGAGEALPAAVDRIEIEIQEAPVHLGNETMSWYAVDAPEGLSKSWTFDIPERATAVNIRGLHHGTNSQIIGGSNTDLEVTKWELWRSGEDRAESSGNMPVVNEDYALRKNYLLLSNWAPFAVNLRGTDAGSVTLKLIAGVRAGPDDFEVRDVYAEVWGTSEPDIGEPIESEA